jgi:hypothetical protein
MDMLPLVFFPGSLPTLPAPALQGAGLQILLQYAISYWYLSKRASPEYF